MAYVEKFIASVASGDQTKQIRSVSQAVTPAKARLWFAAADHAARMTTDVGLMLNALNDTQSSDGTTGLNKYSVTGDDYNDAYAPPAVGTDIFNSNQIKLTYNTTNAGLPVTESTYIPQRLDTLTFNSDGKTYDITVAPFPNIETQLIATGRSTYGTAITSLVSATPNDI